MSMMQAADLDIEKLLKDASGEIEHNLILSIRENDNEYVELFDEMRRLQESFPVIEVLIDGQGDVTLSKEDHKAYIRYINLKMLADEKERRQLYFQGHAHCFAYLKRIGMLQ